MRAETRKNHSIKDNAMEEKSKKDNKTKKPRSYTRMNAALFKTALDGSFGNISLMAQRIGVSRDAIYDWINKHPEARQAMLKEREALVDFAENQLGKLIQEKNPTAIIFTLKTLGKSRGYIEQVQLANPDGTNLVPPKIVVKDNDGAVAVSEILQGD